MPVQAELLKDPRVCVMEQSGGRPVLLATRREHTYLWESASK